MTGVRRGRWSKNLLSKAELRIIAERYAVYLHNRPKQIARDFNLSKHQVERIGKKALNANPSPPRTGQESNPYLLREGCGGGEAALGSRMDGADS